jgi:adenine C2-methylase RlmN of 23S rRNA A2503 and tRNA A37
MKHFKPRIPSIFATIALSVSASAMAVTDEEFKALQEQMNQLADAVENQPTSKASKVHIGGYGELHYNNLEKVKSSSSSISTVSYCSSAMTSPTASAFTRNSSWNMR